MTFNLHSIVRRVNLIIDVRKLISLVYFPRYVRHWCLYQSYTPERLLLVDSYPCLNDWVASTPYDPHYFYQGAWLARQLVESKPDWHLDVGSSVLTVGVMSAAVPTVFVDYRPLNASLPNLKSVAGTILSLPFANESIHSLSCLHVLEHIGLGRYGDPIDPDGARKAATELSRILARGGRLYLTTPVGRNRVCFNAHRVFSPDAFSDLLPELTLHAFAWVDDAGRFHSDGHPQDATASEYACGFYVFEKCI